MQIFLWYGANDYEIAHQLRGWVSVFEKKYSGLNIVSLDGAEFRSSDKALADLKNALQVDSLFGANKLIVLKNFQSDKSKVGVPVLELIISSLEKLPATFFLVFIEQKKPAANTRLYKAIQAKVKQGTAEEKLFDPPKPFELSKWILAKAKTYNANLDRQAADLLIALIGNDLWALDNELNKLAHYKKNELITAADVSKVVKGKFNDDIFQLMDAISARNKPRVLELFNEQIASGAAEMYLLTMLVRQFRMILMMKDLLSRGNYSSGDLARELKMHPFVAQKAMSQLNRFSLDDLKKTYRRLLEIDLKLKSDNVGLEPLFTLLVADL